MEEMHGGAARARRALRSAGLAIVLGLLAAAGCGGESIAAYTAAGHPTAVSHYETFGVVLPTAQELRENQMHPENMQRLAELTVQHMQALGYKPAGAQDADLLIGLSPAVDLYGTLVVVNDSARVDQTLDEDFDGEGRLNVTFIDRKAKRVVLERVAKTRVDRRLGEDQMREIVAKIIQEVPRAAM